MKTTNVTKLAVLMAAIAITLTGCGGGGGGSAPAPITPTTPTTPTSVKCPDGSTALGTANCPTVTPNAPTALSAVTPRLFKQGVTIQFNGALDPNSVTNVNVVLWKGTINTGTKVAGTASLANGKELTYAAVQFLANGSSYTLDINVNDTIGRPVHLTIPFTTTAMVCADNAIWSNPANFSSIYQDCVADIGVRTLVNPAFNTSQDDTCIVTVGVPLASACKAYMANGTMMLANTSIVANGHSTMWMAYIGTDGKSVLVLLDVNNMSNPVPLGVKTLSAPLISLIGNPTGVNIDTNVSGIPGVLTKTQVTWNASSSTFVPTCELNC